MLGFKTYLLRLALRSSSIREFPSKAVFILAQEASIWAPGNGPFLATKVFRGERFASTRSQKTKKSSCSTPQDSQNKISQHESRNHIKAFFAQYPGFIYDPAYHYMDEFYRMTTQFGWNPRGTIEQEEKFRAARIKLNKASVLQFNEIYGTDENNIAAWKKLFANLGIGKAPKEVIACKSRVREFHTNLCDLVDNHTRGTQIRRFKNKVELRDYTLKTGKFFPQKDADAGGVLRFLLRHLFNPPSNLPTRPPYGKRKFLL
ncbi:unnamed protein product [Rhizoctonia solani]|uniref:Uncharacterized protein n=1 Tax=Rhizoctonia solani TaxID=456999 RepID=A0A8H3HW39_9AGAM|nr:unnamed protein product [Rhizoctonia solani]